MLLRCIPYLLLLSFASQLPAQVTGATIVHAGQVRQYDLHLPPIWAPGEKLPLVFNLHYEAGDAQAQDALAEFSPIADTAGFILCHPQGLGNDWNAGFGNPYSTGPDDVGFISALIDSINAVYNIDLRRVYVAGMGRGGFMALRLACELDDRVAAVASVGGSMADSALFYCSNVRPTPVMLVNGTADSVVNYFAGAPGLWPDIDSLVDFWIGRNACAVPAAFQALPDVVNEGSTINAYQYTCGAQSELLLYQVNNGGHAWPGSAVALPNGGLINRDVNGSEEVWKFFLRFRLPDSLVGAPEATVLEESWEAWPNPVADRLELRTDFVVLELALVDAQGRLVHSEAWRRGQRLGAVEMAGLAPGVYGLVLRTERGIVVKRILKDGQE